MKSCLDYRADFPMLQKKIQGNPLVYLDSAATAFTPDCVIDAMSDFYRNHYGTVNRALYSLAKEATDLYHQARCTVQHFLNADHSEEIIFTRGTTASINLLAQSFSETFIRPGDVIILSEIEHHSNIVPWQLMAERWGAVLRYIPVNNRGEFNLDEFEELLDEKVKLVSLAHISNVIGTVHPVKKIIEMAHAYGAHVCLDGAQSAPHMKIDVQDLDVDFFVFSGHKLYGPTGIGVLYGKQELLEKMIPIEGGGDMIEKVTLEESTYSSLPTKFEAGTPMIAEAIGLAKAIDYLTEIGMDAIHKSGQELQMYATEQLRKIEGVTIIGQAAEKGALVSFTAKGVHPLDLATLLDCRGIAVRTGHLCSQPAMERFGVEALIRISFGFYNTKEEIDTFLTSLRSVLEVFR